MRLPLMVMFLLTVVSSPARANAITYAFSGTLTKVNEITTTFLMPGLETGDFFWGELAIDLDVRRADLELHLGTEHLITGVTPMGIDSDEAMLQSALNQFATDSLMGHVSSPTATINYIEPFVLQFGLSSIGLGRLAFGIENPYDYRNKGRVEGAIYTLRVVHVPEPATLFLSALGLTVLKVRKQYRRPQ